MYTQKYFADQQESSAFQIIDNVKRKTPLSIDIIKELRVARRAFQKWRETYIEFRGLKCIFF